MRLFLFVLAVVLTVLGCSDGKLNLLLVFWGEHEESSSSRERVQDPPKPSSPVIVPSSSSLNEPPPPSSISSSSFFYSSSEEEVVPPPPSSSSEPSSSSSRPARSSSAKTDGSGNTYVDYPTLEVGAPGVKKGKTTRYWDGCKPDCAYYGSKSFENKPKPWFFAKACDINGRNEMPLIYLHPSSDQWGTYYNRVPNAMRNGEGDTDWVKSQTYKDWVNTHPDFPKGSFTYTCFDMIPFTINDTLAYAFAATDPETLPCGKCAALQFDGEWPYDLDKDGESKSRVTHRALKGKTLIVMASNTGTVDKNHFDIMFPGGGLGANDCFSEQIGLPKGSKPPELGFPDGGLLSECSYNVGTYAEYGKPSDRFTLEEWQKCLADRCHRAFDGLTKKGERNYMLEGCLWSSEWFYAADNPNVDWKEVPCPQYLIDVYKSTVTPELPTCSNSSTPPCQIWGLNSN